MSRSPHVPEDLLQAFVLGEVDERVGTHVAEHIDECPMCSARAATADPLAAAFAAVPDPVVPSALVARSLAEASRPARDSVPVMEIVVGVALLALAVGLMGAGHDPVRLAVQVGHALEAVRHGAVAVGAPSAALWGVGTALLGGAVVLAQRWEAGESGLPARRRAT